MPRPRLTDEEKAERRRACQAAYYQRNRDRRLERNRASAAKWRREHPEANTAYQAAYYKRNRDRLLERQRAYDAARKR